MNLHLTALAAAVIACALAKPPQQDGAPFVQDEPRAMTRVVYFGGGGVSGEYVIEYGKPAWRADYDQKFAAMTRGKRLRLGKDWWTTLNSYCPVTFADKVELKPGAYNLVLECSAKSEWSVIALDPEPLRKQRIDPFGSEQTKGGTAIPMKYELVKESAPELSIRFVADEKETRLQTLEIRFGKHRLTTTVKPKV